MVNDDKMMDAENARARAERYLASCPEYTTPQEHERLIANWMRKGDSATQIVGDFIRRAGDPKGKRILEPGFGNGSYVVAFARAGAIMSGLEVNPVLYDIAQESLRNEGLSADLRVYDGLTFPFADNSFDYAYATSVLEHVSDPEKFLEETCRVLKPGGKFYLAFPNRLAPRETHTRIWFLNYVPRRVAEIILRRVFGRNTLEELNLHFVSFFSMRRMMRGTLFRVCYEYGGATFPRRALKRILGALGIHHSAILRTVMVVLEKSASDT